MRRTSVCSTTAVRTLRLALLLSRPRVGRLARMHPSVPPSCSCSFKRTEFGVLLRSSAYIRRPVAVRIQRGLARRTAPDSSVCTRVHTRSDMSIPAVCRLPRTLVREHGTYLAVSQPRSCEEKRRLAGTASLVDSHARSTGR
jgi:hypothetical protein